MIYYKSDELGPRSVEEVLANLGDYAISDEELDRLHAISWEEYEQEQAEQEQTEQEQTEREPFERTFAIFYEGMPYSEYLKTREWHKVRILAFWKYGYRCQACTSTVNIQIHHRTYGHLYHEDAHLTDLAVLCALCHARHHAGEIDIERRVPRQGES